MRRFERICLAGPDRFHPEPLTLLQRQRALCAASGFEALSALDAGVSEGEPDEITVRERYAAGIGRLRRADAVIANCTPWRGPNADPGTAFEAGVASGLGKPVFAYLNVDEEDDSDHCIRVLAHLGGGEGADGRWRDPDGCEIEDLGLPETLMLWAEARRFFTVVTDDPLNDLTGLELCLEALRQYAET